MGWWQGCKQTLVELGGGLWEKDHPAGSKQTLVELGGGLRGSKHPAEGRQPGG